MVFGWLFFWREKKVENNEKNVNLNEINDKDKLDQLIEEKKKAIAAIRTELNKIEERLDREQNMILEEKKALISRQSALREDLKRLDAKIREIYQRKDILITKKN